MSRGFQKFFEKILDLTEEKFCAKIELVSTERGDVAEGDRGVTPPALRATSPDRGGLFPLKGGMSRSDKGVAL